MKSILIKTLIIIVVTVVVMFAYLKWAFWEPSDIKRDSLVYWLKVPTVAKDFPVWNIEGKENFDIGIAEGVKQSSATLYYKSSLSITGLIDKSKRLGFKCQRFENEGAVCNKSPGDYKSQQIIISDKEVNRQVRVNFGGY